MEPLRVLMALCLLIGLAVGASVKSSSDEDEDSMTSSTTYTDQWAVHIEGGNAIADSIAARHGFTNLGPVCTCLLILFFISSLSSIFLSIFTVHLVFNSSHKTNVDVILPSCYAHFSCFCTPPTRSVTRTHQRKGLPFFPLPPTDAVKVSPDPNSERNTNFIYL